jgi:excisionase family DNA binding protein
VKQIKADYEAALARKRDREYETLEHAAHRLDTSLRTVRRMIARGELTGYRFGPRMIRVLAADVDALLRPIPTTTGGAA